MKALIKKEFKLALHPTVPLFWLLSAMLIIPNYPYYVAFFYTTLGLFFVCLTGRENHDIQYSMMLPVAKRDIVRGRFIFTLIVECVQVIVAIPFAVLRARLVPAPNAAGMDANVALFGLSLIMLGLFNIVFFTRYYSAPDKVGGAFIRGSIAVFVYVALAETAAHVVPFVRDRLDTPDPQFMTEKLCVLAIGIIAYAALTWAGYRISVRRFEHLDI